VLLLVWVLLNWRSAGGVLGALIVCVATFWKTVLYFLVEMCGHLAFTKHVLDAGERRFPKPASALWYSSGMHLEPSVFLKLDSCGQVTKSEFFDERGKAPVRGGLICPRLWPSPDAREMAHIEASLGLVHPAHASAIAERIGIAAKDVMAVARGEAWLDGHTVQRGEIGAEDHQQASFVEGLVRAGAGVEDWIVRRVPVISPAFRPLRGAPGGAQMPDLIGYAYMGIMNTLARAQRVTELHAPTIIVASARSKAQAAFERLIDTLDGKPGAAWSPAEPVHFEPLTGKTTRKAAAKGLHGAAFAGETGILVSRGNETLLLAAPGATPRRYPTPALRIYATSTDGKLALFKHARLERYHLLDLESGDWLGEGRDGFPRALVRVDPRAAFVADVPRHRERPVEVAGVPPALNESSPDNRFLWVSDKGHYGGIYDSDTGDLVAWPVLSWLIGAEETDPADDLVRHAAAAFVRTPRDTFRFFTDSRVIEGETELPLPAGAGTPLAAAFDRTGDRLLIATRGEAVVITLDGDAPAIVARYPI
jgi:hypothetical protein